MTAVADPERALLDALATPAGVDAALDARLQSLEAWYRDLGDTLSSGMPDVPGLQPDAALATSVRALQAWIAQAPARWQGQWDDLAPARAVAEAFDAGCMLLVFGKFNAGKSSLCNFLATRVAANGGSTRWFHVEDGDVFDAEARFVEGATETTARLQGVVLAERLVLLDTPGLHSVTPENAALTRRFTDSADGVLWLSSSTAPGQVQELDDLALELRRGKPLQPVITRSDTIDEDEIDGALVRVLCNKSDANRALQEQDVAARAAGRLQQLDLDPALLRTPVSLSVHAARTQGETARSRADAGFDRLYAALQDLAGPALAYKGRKPASMRLHHFDEHVLGDVQASLLPSIERLSADVKHAREALPAQVARLRDLTWRAVVARLPAVLDAHEQGREVQRVIDAVSTRLDAAFHAQVLALLPDHAMPAPERTALSVDANYEDISIDGEDGSHTQVGVDQARLHAALEAAVHVRIETLVTSACREAAATLDAMTASLEALRVALDMRGDRLAELRRALR